MDTILDTLVKHQQEQMASDDTDAVKGVDPTALVGAEGTSTGTLWDVKPADPELLAVLSPKPLSPRSSASRSTARSSSMKSSRSRASRGTRGSARGRKDDLLRSSTKRAAGKAKTRRRSRADTDDRMSASGALDSRSTVSRTSTRSRASRMSTKPNDTVFDLQCRTKDYIQKAGVDKAQLLEVESEIKQTRKEIDRYHKNLGGVLALKTNDNNVARQVDIMERRMVKAQNTYMDTIAHNGQLRTEVNIWRREILFLKKANASIRADIKRITDANHALEQSMKEIQFQHKQNEDEQEALKAMRDMEEETLREKFEAMDADPTALQMALPEMKDVDVDRAGGMHKTKEQELRQNVNTTQWQMSTNSAILENEQKSQPSPKAVFDVVASQTAIESPEDFADKFLQIEAMNYALYRRVDHLIDEGRELKQQLVAMKRKKADVAKVVQGEDETRHNALTGVDKAITAVRDRLEQQRNQYQHATQAARAIRTSLNRMMDMLGAGEQDPEVANGNLMKYFGVFEQRFRNLMLRYITAFFSPELEDAKRRSTRRGRGDRGRNERLGMAQRYVGDADVTLAHLHKAAVENRHTKPIIQPGAFAIGPTVPAGGMNKTLTAVSIPSVDGPKDSRQAAAFVRPWQTGQYNGEDDAEPAPADGDATSSVGGGGSTGGSLPHIEEMFGDRPVSVPVGKLRNRRASGHTPVSPMTSGLSQQWAGGDRASTAPAKHSGGAPASLPQVAGATRG